LNVVKTSVYYLLNAKNPTADKKAEHLGRIERNVVLADNVITALSNFAKLPVPNLRPFVLKQCLDEALETISVPAKIEVRAELPDSLAPVLGDIDLIRIVLSNLIRNARDAMPDGGRLTITAGEEDRSVEVAFTDTGIGISAENLSRIMEPLYTTKARGLGLGLSIARAILDKNKGSLRVVSQPGQGSTFTVRLLAAPE
jgi:signal transduction histidine kinase